jgi:hypothetical protein
MKDLRLVVRCKGKNDWPGRMAEEMRDGSQDEGGKPDGFCRRR